MNWFVKENWGARSLVALYLSVLSGIVLALQYDAAVPYYSLGTLEIVIPFGYFWRALHFYSSQFFYVLLLIHIIAVIIGRYCCWPEPVELLSKSSGAVAAGRRDNWLKLVLSLPVATLLIFTGYILRDDATGESAGVIAENIVSATPIIGGWLNSILFNIGQKGMSVVYANHLIGLGVFWGYLVWEHLRRYRISLLNHGVMVIAILLISLLIPAPMEPFVLGENHISGPWFFVGLQEMLRSIQPLWAGVVFPSLGMLLLYQVMRGCRRTSISFVTAIMWALVYVFFTAIGLLR